MNNFMSSSQRPEIPDYYADLGLQYTATFQEIKQAHNSLVKKCHPDKQGPGECVDASEFRKVNRVSIDPWDLSYGTKTRRVTNGLVLFRLEKPSSFSVNPLIARRTT